MSSWAAWQPVRPLARSDTRVRHSDRARIRFYDSRPQVRSAVFADSGICNLSEGSHCRQIGALGRNELYCLLSRAPALAVLNSDRELV